jgi:hypothetical protein
MVIVPANTMSRASWSGCSPGERKRNGHPVGAGRPAPVGSVRLMNETATVPSSAVAAAGLAGGFLAGRWTGRRDLAGALFAAAGAWCARDWYRASGPVAAVRLSALYAVAMGGSHPLAKRIGAWPSVLAVTAVTVAAAELVTRAVAR